MKPPAELAPTPAYGNPRVGNRTVSNGISPQGCNVFEWAGCAAAVAGCAALSGPALIACVAAAAPGCVKCVT
jgi:hypothetical protein